MTPVVLFAYARPHHLRRTLECLRENRVPRIYAFCDGPKTPEKATAVGEVRALLRQVDWCDLRLVERQRNLGLGVSVRSGVEEVLAEHSQAIVFEDDLVCVPGTYDYLCAALDAYRDEQRVISVTGWTHPQVTPANAGDAPYFDGRAECWVWGTWARAWKGMDRDAETLMRRCRRRGIDPFRYGADLVDMAKVERDRNIWAVRFFYLHMLKGGLCLRPPWSMVEHIGFDEEGTNAKGIPWFKNPPLKGCPPLPTLWPQVREQPECAALWQAMCGRRPSPAPSASRLRTLMRRILRRHRCQERNKA